MRLPERPDTIELGVVHVKDRIAGAGEGVVLQTADGEVAGRVDLGFAASDVPAVLRCRVLVLPSVGALFEAPGVGAGQKVLDVASRSLLAPVKIDVARQTARVVLQRAFVDTGIVLRDRRRGQGVHGRQDIRR